MKYFFDTEFIEGWKKPIPWLPTIGSFNRSYHSVELISIGIVAEDGREYYAVCNEFDLKETWDKFDIKKDFGKPQDLGDSKIYWLRNNVLRPIWDEFRMKSLYDDAYVSAHYITVGTGFNYFHIKNLIKWYGKSRRDMSIEIFDFVTRGHFRNEKGHLVEIGGNKPIEFYAYFADYDWVVFCSIFGRMIDLPKGFPMYCRDLKQTLDEKTLLQLEGWCSPPTFEQQLDFLKSHRDYPKQENEHNALADAKWNKRLFDFLQKL